MMLKVWISYVATRAYSILYSISYELFDFVALLLKA